MTIAKVYYINLTDEQSRTVNREGWGCFVGKTYLSAKAGFIDNIKDAMILGMIKNAATVSVTETAEAPAEEVWMALQNGVDTNTKAQILSRYPKSCSMDVGDFIVWDDLLQVERVASAGFDTVDINPTFFTAL